jgi:hypothetical protein
MRLADRLRWGLLAAVVLVLWAAGTTFLVEWFADLDPPRRDLSLAGFVFGASVLQVATVIARLEMKDRQVRRIARLQSLRAEGRLLEAGALSVADAVAGRLSRVR